MGDRVPCQCTPTCVSLLGLRQRICHRRLVEQALAFQVQSDQSDLSDDHRSDLVDPDHIDPEISQNPIDGDDRYLFQMDGYEDHHDQHSSGQVEPEHLDEDESLDEDGSHREEGIEEGNEEDNDPELNIITDEDLIRNLRDRFGNEWMQQLHDLCTYSSFIFPWLCVLIN